MSTRTLHVLLAALLVAAGISSFVLALMLITLLGRFAKDLDEVFWTWRYVETFVIAGSLTLVAGGIAARRARGS